MIIFVVFLIAFIATTLGASCGLGGGVIIKPVLDAFNIASVSEISFLSGVTVLAMSFYSIVRSLISKDNAVKFDTGTPLGIGAALGGVAGKYLFAYLKGLSSNPERVGGIQAICLGVITFGILIFSINKKKIRTLHVKNIFACLIIGVFLGMVSSFLGIGGGPINMVVLYFFFSMETKEAASNSLYCILLAQLASLITYIVTKTVPEFHVWWLVVMVFGGICGGIVGRIVKKKIKSGYLDLIFDIVIGMIVCICIYNAITLL